MRILLRMGAFAIAITFVLAISLLASSHDPTDGTWLLDVGVIAAIRPMAGGSVGMLDDFFFAQQEYVQRKRNGRNQN
jgi:hypothetical protein